MFNYVQYLKPPQSFNNSIPRHHQLTIFGRDIGFPNGSVADRDIDLGNSPQEAEIM